jgi:hypothetical protein
LALAFTFTLTAVEYFRSPTVVLYLAPEPAAPFQELTRLCQNVPGCSACSTRIIPHVKIADEQDREILAIIEAEEGSQLPIEATAREVEFVELGPPQGWALRTSFRLPTSA